MISSFRGSGVASRRFDPEVLLPEHRAVGDPPAGTDANQERDVGLARARRRQRTEAALEAGVPLVVEVNERRIDDDGVSGRAAVGVADQRSLDLNDGPRRADGVPAGEREPVNVEIDYAALQRDRDVSVPGGPRQPAAGHRSGAAAHDVVGLDDADHRLPYEDLSLTGAGVAAEDGRTERDPGHDRGLAQPRLHDLFSE